ncbi:MAG: Flp pilus assembly complex ATPase component TadA [Erysipelothrix sp.]|nr:Flp pilus assembly complex ATPase component TadA [Erysipelothrix sp.]
MLLRFEELLHFALINKSTDIHFEIIRSKLEISVRAISGFKSFKVKNNDYQLLEYIKYISNLNLIESELPQSGSFSYVFSDQEYFFRVASIKSAFMETCVIRILNKFFLDINIFNNVIDDIYNLLNKETGMIVFSGPTGSGKTTSLYSFIQMFTGKKIYSIEDPIEIFFDNIVQISVNKNRGLTYKSGIKQVLRHDPDIIVIGEIRDENAAQMAIRAAITGHLVVTTIHSKNAIGVINRLHDLGVSYNDIYENIIFISNQRLLKALEKNERWCVYEVINEKAIEKISKEGRTNYKQPDIQTIVQGLKNQNKVQ